jgi:transposase InsO family protein
MEYAAAVRGRYLRAGRAEQKRILDEFCEASGYHRKSAIRLLHRARAASGKRRGRRKEYSSDFVPALKVSWEATHRVCSKRLAPFLRELVPILEHHGELRISEAVRSQLVRVSASTIDRLLRPYRHRPRHGLSTTRSVPSLRNSIPIRTFADKKGLTVGHMETDLAAHCGTSTEGFYLNTLVAVDLVCDWVECMAVYGKGQSRVGGAIDRVRRQVPFKLLGLHSDNGSEFINQALWRYCRQHDITFTRSRPYKKNDQAHVEQKNWSVVRRLVGYDRFQSKAALQALEDLYELVRLHVNFFQPTCKLIDSQRQGAKVRKHYDRAQTPYQRLLAAGALSDAQQEALASYYAYLNPVQLCSQIEQAQQTLWKLASPDPRSKAEAKIIAQLDAKASQTSSKHHKPR